jgi:hypothetical protein
MGRSVPALTAQCPVCDEPMKEDGRTFACRPCRQILIFFPVAEGAAALWPSAVALPKENGPSEGSAEAVIGDVPRGWESRHA